MLQYYKYKDQTFSLNAIKTINATHCKHKFTAREVKYVEYESVITITYFDNTSIELEIKNTPVQQYNKEPNHNIADRIYNDIISNLSIIHEEV